MSDITITRSGEFMVAQIEGNTDAGTDYLDAWLPDDPHAEYMVVDAGLLILPDTEIDAFMSKASTSGLSIHEKRAL